MEEFEYINVSVTYDYLGPSQQIRVVCPEGTPEVLAPQSAAEFCSSLLDHHAIPETGEAVLALPQAVASEIDEFFDLLFPVLVEVSTEGHRRQVPVLLAEYEVELSEAVVLYTFSALALRLLAKAWKEDLSREFEPRFFYKDLARQFRVPTVAEEEW